MDIWFVISARNLDCMMENKHFDFTSAIRSTFEVFSEYEKQELSYIKESSCFLFQSNNSRGFRIYSNLKLNGIQVTCDAIISSICVGLQEWNSHLDLQL